MLLWTYIVSVEWENMRWSENRFENDFQLRFKPNRNRAESIRRPQTVTLADADDVRRGFLRRVEIPFFTLFLFWMDGVGGGVRVEKLCIYFYYTNKRKEFFLYRNIHDLPTGCILSESLDAHKSERERERRISWMNHPRMVMEFYCYILWLHTWWVGGLFVVCACE